MAIRLGRCKLSDLLKRRKMTQQDLAEKLNKPKQTISRYANNQNIMGLEVALNICDILNCELSDLYEFVRY